MLSSTVAHGITLAMEVSNLSGVDGEDAGFFSQRLCAGVSDGLFSLEHSCAKANFGGHGIDDVEIALLHFVWSLAGVNSSSDSSRSAGGDSDRDLDDNSCCCSSNS